MSGGFCLERAAAIIATARGDEVIAGNFAVRSARDATLSAPRLMPPAIQVNMRAGRLPEPEANRTRCLRVPLNAF